MGGLFGKDFDWGEAALGFFADPQAMAARSRRKQFEVEAQIEAEKARQKQQAIEAAAAALTARGIPAAEARVIAADQANSAGYLRDVNKPWETGPGGGSRYNPVDQKWIGAPRWDDGGNYYGPNADASQEPQRIIKGTKVVPVQPGGKGMVFDSVTGQPVNSGLVGSTVFRKGQRYTMPDGRVFELVGDDDTDPKNWREITGGAGRSGPPMFP